MGIHIETSEGAYAECVLLPGDPLRARAMADALLTDVTENNQIRGMLGYTGMACGKRISIQSTGMGMPSMAIYAHELMHEFGVRRLIRIGTCGALQAGIRLGDLVLAMSASTDSNMNRLTFCNMDFAPCGSFDLLEAAVAQARKQSIPFHVGGVMTSDTFYPEQPNSWKKWARHGVLAMEMETSALYTLAARSDRHALSILTATDNLATGDHTSPAQRESAFEHATRIAIELA